MAAHCRLHAWACHSSLSSGPVSESGRPEGRAASSIRESAVSSSRWAGPGPPTAAVADDDGGDAGEEGEEEEGKEEEEEEEEEDMEGDACR